MIDLDLNILTAAIAGDDCAVTIVLDRMRRPVFSYCKKWMVRRADAEDVVQEVMIEIVRTLPRVREPTVNQFVSLVFAIAQHRSIDAVRRARRDMSSLWDEPPEVPCSLSPDRVIVGREELAELADALRQLKPFQRAVIALRFEGLTSAEIGAELDRPDTSVRVEYSRAMEVLRHRVRVAI